jgi:hypothetical protein
MPKLHKEIVSWSFLLAGVVGGVVRMILVLMSSLDVYGRYASLLETMLFVLGIFVFVRAQLKEGGSRPLERAPQQQYSRVR